MRTPQMSLRAKRGNLRAFLALSLVLVFASCGGSGGSADVGPDSSLGPANSIEDLIYSDAYSGKLTVYFNESVASQLESSSASDVILSDSEGSPEAKSFLSTSSLEMVRAVDAPVEVVKAQRVKLEKLSGRTLVNWNLVYRINAADPAYAVQILRNMQALPSVDKIYPEMKPSPTSLLTTPDLTTWQGYLKPEATHGGVNAEAAWAAGVTGANIYIVDNEHGMNFDHEEFNLVKANLSLGGNYLYQPECAPGFPPEYSDCDSWIAHGTAVTGILIAGHNDHGIKGFVPDAYYVHATMSGSVSNDLYGYTNGGNDDIEPGTIWVIEVALPGKFSGPSYPDDPYGQVPVELWPDVFNAIEQATAYGVTVIEGGGNGQMDLDNPELYTGDWDFAHDLSYEDAGAVMVGASGGADEIMASAFTNYGSRFNAFSWGFGVATTAYPYGEYDWTGTTSPIPPNDTTNAYFMDNFGGTSSAAAIVAGSAALVQSYARQELGHRRYIMPLKLRQILYDSGVAQVGGGGNIGKQPRIDVAMGLVDTFLATVNSSYSQLAADEQLTTDEMIALRALGVGIICKEFDPTNSDPSCPDSELFPEGTKIAKHYDFDGDNRADLVQFSDGNWKIDLSSTGPAADGFGEWDVDVDFTAISGDCGVWPYVEDMNSDGRADFVAYDKCAGTFYVSLTDTDLTRNNTWHDWDWVIDYSSQWHDQMEVNPEDADYSRPFIAQYNNDGFIDIGIACSDGFVRVDYGDGTETGLGNFEWSSQLITDTMLAEAPGIPAWAYLPAPADFNLNGTQFFGIKVPDTHPDQGRMYIIPHDGVSFQHSWDWLASTPYIFGGSDHVPISALLDGGAYPNISIKNGDWLVSDNWYYDSLHTLAPVNIYGGQECHPVVGKFDNDSYDDRAVMCPNEWRIAYSSDEYASLKSGDGARHIALGYDPCDFSLPGHSYAGGISYTNSRQLMDLYHAQHPADPTPISVDMVTIVSCEE
ncbi:MAG: S8 family serine peptidase [Patescibacteria group bacterium]